MLASGQPEFWTADYYYGHGMVYKAGLLGDGGQALGYQSDGGYLPDKDVTIVVWGNRAENGPSNLAASSAANLGYIETEG